jgi:hypothetical protein
MTLSTYLNNLGVTTHTITENDIAVITGTETQIRKIIREEFLEIKEIYTPRFPNGAWKVFTREPKQEIVTKLMTAEEIDALFFA